MKGFLWKRAGPDIWQSVDRHAFSADMTAFSSPPPTPLISCLCRETGRWTRRSFSRLTQLAHGSLWLRQADPPHLVSIFLPRWWDVRQLFYLCCGTEEEMSSGMMWWWQGHHWWMITNHGLKKNPKCAAMASPSAGGLRERQIVMPKLEKCSHMNILLVYCSGCNNSHKRSF